MADPISGGDAMGNGAASDEGHVLNAAEAVFPQAAATDLDIAFPVRRMSRNALFAGGNMLTSTISGLILLPIMLRQLGPTLFGISALAMAAVGYASLFDLGINIGLTRIVAEERARGDLDGSGRISTVTTTLLALYGLIGAFAGIVVLIPALPHLNMFGLGHTQLGVFRQVMFILAIQTGLAFPFSVGNSLLCGLQDFHLTYIVSGVASLARMFLAIVLLERGMGLVGLTVLGLVTGGATWAANAVIARKRLPGLRISRRNLEPQIVRALLGDTTAMGVWGLAGYALHSGDRLLLGLSQPPMTITQYDVGARLALYSRALLHGWLDTLLPHSAHLNASGNEGTLQHTYLQGTRSLLGIYGLATSGAIGVGAAFLDLWIGRHHGTTYTVLILLMTSNLVQAHTLAGHVILVGTGEVRRFARVIAGYPVLIVLFGVPLARRGATGMALAVLLAVFIQELRVAQLLHRTVAPDWRAVGRWAVLPVTVAGGASIAVGRFATAPARSSTSGFLLGGLLLTLTYILVYAVVGFTSGERRFIARKVTSRGRA